MLSYHYRVKLKKKNIEENNKNTKLDKPLNIIKDIKKNNESESVIELHSGEILNENIKSLNDKKNELDCTLLDENSNQVFNNLMTELSDKSTDKLYNEPIEFTEDLLKELLNEPKLSNKKFLKELLEESKEELSDESTDKLHDEPNKFTENLLKELLNEPKLSNKKFLKELLEESKEELSDESELNDKLELSDELELSDAPELDDSDAPELDDSDAPEKDDGDAPELDDGNEPEKDDGDAPELDDGNEPEKDDSDAPELDDGNEPEKDDGNEPEKDDSDAPELDDGDAPELDDGDAPEKDDGDAPELDDGDAPELDDGDAPELDEPKELGNAPEKDDKSELGDEPKELDNKEFKKEFFNYLEKLPNELEEYKELSNHESTELLYEESTHNVLNIQDNKSNNIMEFFLTNNLNAINNDKLLNKWVIYYHDDKNLWDANSYIKLSEINSPSEFWKIYNNWGDINNDINLVNKYYFLMRENILPIWEDPNNVNGGCWSIKVNDIKTTNIWEELSLYLVCEILCPTIYKEIIGISICLKKNKYSIIKIWNTNSSNNSLTLINTNILNKHKDNIIYIAHNNEN